MIDNLQMWGYYAYRLIESDWNQVQSTLKQSEIIENGQKVWYPKEKRSCCDHWWMKMF